MGSLRTASAPIHGTVSQKSCHGCRALWAQCVTTTILDARLLPYLLHGFVPDIRLAGNRPQGAKAGKSDDPVEAVRPSQWEPRLKAVWFADRPSERRQMTFAGAFRRSAQWRAQS
jgi:hypothetical protein